MSLAHLVLVLLGCSAPVGSPARPLEGGGDAPVPGGDDVGDALAERPFGTGPSPEPVTPLDPNTTWMLRWDLLVGPLWRSRTTDIVLSTTAEFGQMRGFSGSFHTAMIHASPPVSFFGPAVVRALDFPVGVGGLYRGRLRKRAMYGSVGVTAGILVHRAKIDGDRVQRRVDPDFRLPLRLAWTIADVGASVALVGGYSVRRRTYERRGATIWSRNALRVGVVLGLHWDRAVRRPSTRGGSAVAGKRKVHG